MIVVDTSAWVEFLRATGSAPHLRLREAMEEGEDLGVPDVVRLELLAGAGDEADVARLGRLLARFVPLPTASPGDAELAAALYRSARRRGGTVRSLLDCLVAAVALRVDAPVLARDRDFSVLAGVCPLVLL